MSLPLYIGFCALQTIKEEKADSPLVVHSKPTCPSTVTSPLTDNYRSKACSCGLGRNCVFWGITNEDQSALLSS